jgi:hypothetical protein
VAATVGRNFNLFGGIFMNTTESAQMQEPPIACNPGAFTAEEREKWQALGDRFIRAAKARRDLPNGFAFDIDRTPETLRDLAEFVELESRCCPFVDFTVRAPAGGSGVVLEMTGRTGVKEMLAAELGLDR